MSNFDEFINKFKLYNLLLYDINDLPKYKPSEFNFDVVFSNNFCYPQHSLGFIYNIHQAKENTKKLNSFSNRKKVYLVTSLFEKTIDYKNKDSDNNFKHSIADSLDIFIKSIDKNFPKPLNRAFLKIWEMIILFDLIPDSNTFVSSHLAEGPGSFIQATILYRDFLKNNKKISSTKNDLYNGITLFSDHDYLQMQTDFINYINKTKPGQLKIFNNKSTDKIDEMIGGHTTKINKNIDNDLNYSEIISEPSNGDLTKLNTILQFAGASEKLSNFITADGGFDWKNENLQEQEAYKLILGQIFTALKIQDDKGSFIIKIFESYTYTTLKIIEFLRSFYDKVYIYKPYTSRISNSEKYIVCKNFNRKLLTNDISNKIDSLMNKINKNEEFNIFNIFTNLTIDRQKINVYKKINLTLLTKQYIGINNILEFIDLDNYNGVEYNTYLQKQITASYFWNSLFLNPSMYNKFSKYHNTYNYLNYDFKNNTIFINDYKLKQNNIQFNDQTSEELNQNKSISLQRNTKITNKNNKSITKINNTKQKGGNVEHFKNHNNNNNNNNDDNSISSTDSNIKKYQDNIDIDSDDMIIGTMEDI